MVLHGFSNGKRNPAILISTPTNRQGNIYAGLAMAILCNCSKQWRKKSEKVVGWNEFGPTLIFEDFATKLKAFTAIHKQELNYLENLLDSCNYIEEMYK